jgi:hypothetical protein
VATHYRILIFVQFSQLESASSLRQDLDLQVIQTQEYLG